MILDTETRISAYVDTKKIMLKSCGFSYPEARDVDMGSVYIGTVCNFSIQFSINLLKYSHI